MSSIPHHPPAAAQATLHRTFSIHDALAVYTLAGQDSPLGRKTKQALDITHEALQRFGVDQVALSFNGGKDCTVLVHLLCAALLHHLHPALFFPASSPSSPSTSSPPPPSPVLLPLPTIYIRTPSPFPQVEAFVSLCVSWYNLELEAQEGGMKEVLQGYLDRRSSKGKGTEAVLVGTRRGDPHGATLTPLCPTDPSWPSFMRVHPILDWSYSDVWAFLRCPTLSLGASSSAGSRLSGPGFQGRGGLEWCELYDYGYTSLGSTHNTFPNPLLRATTTDGHFSSSASIPAIKEGGEGAVAVAPLGGWRPAWELEDEGMERAGREPPRPVPPPTSTSTTTATEPASSSGLRQDDVAADSKTPIGSRGGTPEPVLELGKGEGEGEE
ncbi:hypothetical protein JCM11641_006970 [Rhodosporidiobolus odoratus]